MKDEDIQKLVGRLLTIIDATVEGANSTNTGGWLNKNQAIKDLIKASVWDWYASTK